ncbi:MAG: hypothetical protein ABGW98_07110, partial [Myxococcales bacterium]
ETGDIVAGGGDERVRIEMSMSPRSGGFHGAEMIFCVDEEDVVVAGLARGKRGERTRVVLAPRFKGLAHGNKPGSCFGMVGGFNVILEPRIFDHANSSGDVHTVEWYLTDLRRATQVVLLRRFDSENFL